MAVPAAVILAITIQQVGAVAGLASALLLIYVITWRIATWKTTREIKEKATELRLSMVDPPELTAWRKSIDEKLDEGLAHFARLNGSVKDAVLAATAAGAEVQLLRDFCPALHGLQFPQRPPRLLTEEETERGC